MSTIFNLHLRAYDLSHTVRRLLLYRGDSVGVCAEGAISVVAAKYRGHGLDINNVLKGQGGEGVSRIVQAYVREVGELKDFVLDGGH